MTPNVCIDCTRVGCPVAREIPAYAKSCAYKPRGPRVCVMEAYDATIIPSKALGDYVLKEWAFLYSDGIVEAVSIRERIE